MAGSMTATRNGLTRGVETIRAKFWTPLLGTNAAPTRITKGAVCVPDFYQRGAYLNSANVLRAAVGGAPDYSGNDGSEQNPTYNITVINDQAGFAQATRFQPFVLLDNSLDSGIGDGLFAVSGTVVVQTNGVIAVGNRLSLDTTSNTTAGKLKVAAVNDTVVAIARQNQGGNMWLVDLVEPHQATTTGAL